MAVDFAKKKKTRRIQFLTGVHYDGTDYGPDYPKDVADVIENEAQAYVEQGRARYVEEVSLKEKGGK